MIKPVVLLLACATLLGSAGCAAYAHGTGGVASNLGGAAPAALGGVIDGEYGGGVGLTSFVWPSLNVHVRVGPDLFQFAPSVSLRGALPEVVTPVYGLGLRVLSLEANDGRFGFGMFSPYAQLGLFIAVDGDSAHDRASGRALGAGSGLVVQAEAGYDVRFTRQPNAFWGAVSIGYAAYAFLQ